MLITYKSPALCLTFSSTKDSDQPGLEVIKLELIIRLKIKRNDWLLADTCIYFESETYTQSAQGVL